MNDVMYDVMCRAMRPFARYAGRERVHTHGVAVYHKTGGGVHLEWEPITRGQLDRRMLHMCAFFLKGSAYEG
eukprot:395340-Pyramimonas_sp.AAC.2